MVLTSINEVGTPGGMIKPFVGYTVPEGQRERMVHTGQMKWFECTETPELLYSKYYAGCLREGDRLLVKRLGGAGDVIWGLPVIKEIKQRFNKITIGYWVSEKDMPLLVGNPYIDEAMHDPDYKKVMTYDWVLDYYETIERYNPAEYEEAYDIHFKWALNELPKGDLMGNLFITDFENYQVKRIFGENYIVVALNSSSPKRTYFQMGAIIDRILAETDYKILVSGDYPIELPSNKRIVNLIRKTTLREFLAIVNNSKLVVCTDSGNTHFAGQLRKPCVALYSTAHADTRTKYYPLMKFLQSKEYCSPCVKLGEYCPKEPQCLTRINVSAVMNRVKELI